VKYRALALAPAAWVGAFAAGALAVPVSAAPAFIRTEIEAAKLMALVGCVAAARAFSPGDYLRRAWLILGGCWVLFLVRDALSLALPRDTMVGGLPLDHVLPLFALGGNLLGVVGAFMLAKAWHVAGLELPGTRAQRAVVMALWVALAVAIAGRSMLSEGRQVFAGDVPAVVWFASAFSDLLSMCFLAPVFFTALALRGGLLRWTWGFFTASMLFWLFYDAAPLLVRALDLGEPGGRVLRESFRGAACLYCFSAGMAQVMALRAPLGPSPARRA
jgi:hypothetical protein